MITPNTPVRQIWISALSTSFKLDWQEKTAEFILPKTGESLQPLMVRLIHQFLASKRRAEVREPTLPDEIIAMYKTISVGLLLHLYDACYVNW